MRLGAEIFLAPPRLAGGAAVISIGAEPSLVPGGWRWHLHPPPSQQTPCCKAPSKFTLKPTGFRPRRTNVISGGSKVALNCTEAVKRAGHGPCVGLGAVADPALLTPEPDALV